MKDYEIAAKQKWLEREREVSELKRFMKAYSEDKNHSMMRYTQFEKYKAVYDEKHWVEPPVDPIQQAIEQAVRELKE